MSAACDELVSVIIPAFNAAATIDETLQSLRRQTYEHLEIIVVDDGSADGTAEAVRRHAAQDPRVRLVVQANAGVAAARNVGLAEARGTFVAPVDADDLWRPEKIEVQLAEWRARGPGTVLVYTWYADIDEQSRIMTLARPEEEGDVVVPLCTGNIVGHASSPLMRLRDVLDVGGYDPSLRAQRAQGCEDWKLYLALAGRGTFAVVRSFLTGYRQTPNSMSADIVQMLRSHSLVVAAVESDDPQQRRLLRESRVGVGRYFLRRALKAGDYRGSAEALAQTLQYDPLLGARLAASLSRMVVRAGLNRRKRLAPEPRGPYFLAESPPGIERAASGSAPGSADGLPLDPAVAATGASLPSLNPLLP